MSMKDSKIFTLGDWTVDAARNLLVRGDRELSLQPRAMDVLVCLAAHAGEVVSIESLLQSVWSGAVVTDGSVYIAVSQVRSVLGTDDDGQPYIETIPKRGYRLTALVRWIEPGAAGGGESDAGANSQSAKTAMPQRSAQRSSRAEATGRHGRLVPIGIAAGVAVLLVLAGVVLRLPAPPLAEAGSVAVLPLENLSEESSDNFYAVAMQTEIADRLSRVDGLTVVAPSVASRLTEQGSSPLDLARSLGVATVLSGSFAVDENRFRLALNLASSSSGSVLWARSYDEPFAEAFAVQADVAANVADRLDTRISSTQRTRIARGRTRSEAAYALFLRGLAALETANGPTAMFDALGYFESATEVDPDFAEAYATRALLLATMAAQADAIDAIDQAAVQRQDFIAQARAAAAHALALDPDVGEAHAAMGLTQYLEGNEQAARTSFERAVSVYHHPTVLNIYADIELRAGRLQQARDLLERAGRSDPEYLLLMGTKFLLGAGQAADWVTDAARRYTHAIPEDYRGWLMLGLLELVNGNDTDAGEHLDLADELVGEDSSAMAPNWLAMIAYGFGRLDEPDAARVAFDRFVASITHPALNDPANWVYAYLAINDVDNAAEWAARVSGEPLPPYLSPRHAFMLNATRDSRLEREPFISLRRTLGHGRHARL